MNDEDNYYEVIFRGGPLDGHSERVHENSGWSSVKKVGLTRDDGRVFACYVVGGGSIRQDGLDSTIGFTDSVEFEFKSEVWLEPGEEARIIKYKEP